MHDHTKKVLILGGSSLLVLGTLFGTYAINTFNTGYRITTATSGIVEHDQSSCRQVMNNGSLDIFVPTATSEEFDSFVQHSPAGVQVDMGTGVCGHFQGTCDIGTQADLYGGQCHNGNYYWTCVGPCNVSQQTEITCYAPC